MQIVQKILKILGRILLGLLGFILLLWLLVQTAPVQNFIVGKLTKSLSEDLKTEVKIGHVNLSLFDNWAGLLNCFELHLTIQTI